VIETFEFSRLGFSGFRLRLISAKITEYLWASDQTSLATLVLLGRRGAVADFFDCMGSHIGRFGRGFAAPLALPRGLEPLFSP
jgi:hypothetical protein